MNKIDLISKKNNDEFHIHIDEYDTALVGWFVPKEPNGKIFIQSIKNNEEKMINCSIKRIGVDNLYRGKFDYFESGFHINLMKNEYDEGFIIKHKNNKIEKNLFKFSPYRPIMYVHVPKTAGSTVNKIFKEQFKNNALVHAESNGLEKLDKENHYQFISGHITFEQLRNKIDINKYIKAISFRNPIDHIISHIAWIRLLAEPNEVMRFQAHPVYVQNFAYKLKSFDLSDAKEIKELICTLTPQEINLLDNCQIRYIRKDITKLYVEEIDVQDAIINLQNFDFIGLDNNIDDFISSLLNEHNIVYTQKGRMENVKNNKFGLSAKNKEHFEVLYPLIKYDLKLYDSLIKNNINN